MTDDHSKPASDGQFPMIFKRNLRVVATACVECRLSEIACFAKVEYESERCCPDCHH